VRHVSKVFGLGLAIALLAGCAQSAATPPTAAPAAAQPTTAAASPTAAPAAAAPTAAATSTGAAAATTPAANAANATPAKNPAERVQGTIQSVANNSVTLADGKTFTVSDKTRIIRVETAKASDLQSGDYVAVTAKRQPDNTLLASIVNVFPTSLKGVAVGQRPMTGGNLMTNATIDKISGDSFTVTFPGGGAQVKLAPDAQITKLVDGSPSDLKEGLAASASVVQGVAQSVQVH